MKIETAGKTVRGQMSAAKADEFFAGRFLSVAPRE